MPIPNLTQATIQHNATDQSFQRGQDYCRAGAVVSLTQRQQTLQAVVEGNEVLPYRIAITFDGGGITATHCTCPYDYGGWCKHIVATLLACVHHPEKIEQRPTLEQLLNQLNPVQTQTLIQSLVEENPALIESIDFYVSRLAAPAPTPTQAPQPKRQTSVDPTPFKRRAREILRGAVRDWEYGRDDDDIAFEMDALMADALAFAAQGDGHNALIALQGITEGCVQNWDLIEDFVGLTPDDVGVDFDPAWTEALLSTDLTDDEVLTWQEELEGWQDQLGSFAMSLEALRQGWDYPPLQRVLQGDITELGAWPDEAPNWADTFSQIRLKILARQERYEDYLNLAQAEGQTQAYMTMLGQLGRVDEAMTVAQAEMTTLEEAQSLAETLRAQNQLPQALQIALQGLRLDPDNPYATFEFATWTSELAAGLGEPAAALEALIIAFKAKPSFKDYQRIAELAAADWPEIQEMLLQHLRSIDHWRAPEAQVDIFLHEDLPADAIAAVSRLSRYYDRLILRVMDAVIETHSQWVLTTARRYAEAIMDEGKAKYYSQAVEWLKRVRAAYRALGQEADWFSYRRDLASTHGRKRKLMGLMDQAHV
jgi:uncharacterized Zn finger protein